MARYLALLRGINVGGNNIIKMVTLKKYFEDAGFKDVVTYIQSGNVIFSSPEKNIIKLEAKIEKELSKKFNYKSCVVLISYDTLKNAVNSAPKDFGKELNKYRYDVIFLKNSITASSVTNDIQTREGVDLVIGGKEVVYFSRLIEKASQSLMPKIIQLATYKQMTIRNWNTTTKLLELMDK